MSQNLPALSNPYFFDLLNNTFDRRQLRRVNCCSLEPGSSVNVKFEWQVWHSLFPARSSKIFVLPSFARPVVCRAFSQIDNPHSGRHFKNCDASYLWSWAYLRRDGSLDGDWNRTQFSSFSRVSSQLLWFLQFSKILARKMFDPCFPAFLQSPTLTPKESISLVRWGALVINCY